MPVVAIGFGLSLFALHAIGTPYYPNDSWALEGAFLIVRDWDAGFLP